jgi:hypothetical protein
MNLFSHALTRFVFLFALCAGAAFGANPDDEINRLEDLRYDAMVKNDYATLSDLLADDWVYHQLSGKIATKASYIETLKKGDVKVRGYKRYDVKTRFYGDTAVVQGKTTVDVTLKGEDKTLDLLYTNVWANGPKGWQLVARQSTTATK